MQYLKNGKAVTTNYPHLLNIVFVLLDVYGCGEGSGENRRQGQWIDAF